MELSSLNAISPIDGRYRSKVENLHAYFSESALIRYRVKIEIAYFIALCELNLPQLPNLTESQIKALNEIHIHFTESNAQAIKDIEKITNHDVKAVEYYLKEQFKSLNLGDFIEFIHFGLTSQDVNNTATPLLLKEGIEDEVLPTLNEVLNKLEEKSKEWASIPIMSRTHGQPASTSLLGKEFKVFHYRLQSQLKGLFTATHSAKFGGAVGNFNAHYAAYPNEDWLSFGDQFVAGLGLDRHPYTTQIEPYDHLAELCDGFKRANTILIDLSRDVWTYISMDYFKQKIKKGEVGSSTMPHKVNPIDFENCEGNLGIANALFEHFSSKLPISRLQRDLTDSTVLRNLGVPLAHSLLAYKNLLNGLNKLLLNEDKIHQDLDAHWELLAEPIQTILRRESYPEPYEALKALTRKNEKLNPQILGEFIDNLDVSDSVKEELKSWTPFNYTGKVYGG